MTKVSGFPPGLESLDSDFEFLDEVGRGGMAVVYRARDRSLGREVAIKVLLHSASDEGGEAAERLKREARVAAQLEHPHIVPLYGIRRIDAGGLVLIMQFIRGPTLKEQIRGHGPFSVDRTCRVLREITGALAYAHDSGVIHRDVKPENIFIEQPSGRALLGDFGVAKASRESTGLTRDGGSIGTPNYMAPEAIEGRATAKSDLYALGLVGWEMLTGHQPWGGESLYSVIDKQRREPLPSITRYRRDVPKELTQALRTSTAKRPSDRWLDASAFQAVIEDISAGRVRGESGSTLPPTARIRRSIDRGLDSAAVGLEGMLSRITAVGRVLAHRGWQYALLMLILAGGGAWLSGQLVAPDEGRSPSQEARLLALEEDITESLAQGRVEQASETLDRYLSLGGSSAATARWQEDIQSARMSRGREAAREMLSSGSPVTSDTVSAEPVSGADQSRTASTQPELPATVRVASNVAGSVYVRPAGGGSFRELGSSGDSFELDPGEYEVELRTPYHPTWSTTRSFSSGESYELRQTFDETTGSLLIAVSGTWARVQLDDGEPQSTPFLFESVGVGPHKVTISRQGFQTLVDTVVVRPGTTTRRTFQLRPQGD